MSRHDRRTYKQCLLLLRHEVRDELRGVAKQLGATQSLLVEAALEEFFSLPIHAAEQLLNEARERADE